MSDGADGADASVGSLLAAADRFAVWGSAQPADAFADHLEAQLLARFAAPTAATGTEDAALSGMIPLAAASDRQSRSGTPRERRIEHEGTDSGSAAPAPLRPPLQLPWAGRPRFPASRLVRQSVAAAVLLVAGTGALAGAALNASPGQPLYGVLRLEQGVWTSLANSADERARLHLQYAQAALAAYDAAVARQSGESAYRDALTSFAGEERAAAAQIAALPAGSDRDSLNAQLLALRERGQHDLRASLDGLSWPLRANVTAVLAQIGAPVPQVAQATISGVSHNGAYTWTITVTGSGFAPGAVLLVDGRPLGTVVSLTPTALVAQVPGGQLGNGSHAIGVGNADGTASIVTSVATGAGQDDHGDHGGAQSTPGGDDHHGGSGGGGSGGGGSGGGGSGGGDGSGSGGSGKAAIPSPGPNPTPTSTSKPNDD